MAKGSLNLTEATTSTRNADLMEGPLLPFEDKIERKRLTSSDLFFLHHLQLHCFQFLLRLPLHVRVFLCLSLILWSFFFDISPPQAERMPQRTQIPASSAGSDSIYLCSEESLRTLFSFFCNKLSTLCCYCGKSLDCESLVFNRQSHAVSVTISWVGGDCFKWLSSPIMRGSPPKYYVNLRWALFNFLLKIYWNLLSWYFRVFVFCNWSLFCLSFS